MFTKVDSGLIDFSETPIGELDATLLLAVRDALDANDNFYKLVLSNNHLTEDAIKVLALILKGQCDIEFLLLSSCNLCDSDIKPIVNALCVKKVVRHLDLSKNPEITSASVPEIARLIATVTSLETVILSGTSLQQVNCMSLVKAVQQNPSIRVLELPYTVGFKILDKVRKNIEKKDEIHAEKASGKDVPEEKVIIDRKDGADTAGSLIDEWGTPPLPRLVLPPFGASLKKTDAGGLRPHCVSDSLWAMELRHLADPAVRNAAVHLCVLDKRRRLFEAHRNEKQRRLAAKRSLGGKNVFPALPTR